MTFTPTSFHGAGGTLAVFVPSNAGLVIVADKRQTPKGVFCDGVEKILRPCRPARTAVVVTGLISLRDMPDLTGEELCDHLAKTPAPIDFGRTALAFLNAENTPVSHFNGQRFADAVFGDVGPYLSAGKLSGFADTRIAQIIVASYDPASRTSSLLAFGVDVGQGSQFQLQPLMVTTLTTPQGTHFGPASERAVLPFGEVPYLQEHVLAGAGKAFLGPAYAEIMSRGRVADVGPELARDAALNLIDAAAKTTETIPAPSGIGGGASAVLLGDEVVVLK
ncbi:hypothetical protein [Bradyrhizobium canariense]|nr:hypothetical protein [Bradyrhizobium canariense]OSI91028.1 hypothetical protein BSZ24_18905 [Bradyrhizobium canariense]OSJ03960.1 hypothetical protein BSZ16_14735 [Bradyrhizobium canariense]